MSWPRHLPRLFGFGPRLGSKDEVSRYLAWLVASTAVFLGMLGVVYYMLVVIREEEVQRFTREALN